MRVNGRTRRTLGPTLLLALTALAVLAACGETVPNPTGAPTIDSFAAAPPNIGVGADSTLSWVVTGAHEDVSLTADPGGTVAENLDASASRVVSPDATTAYTLTVTYGGGETVTATTTVTVGPSTPGAPTIDSFTAAPPTVAVGADSTLSWVVTGTHDDVRLSADPGGLLAEGLDASGTRVVSPSVATTYTLTVTYDGSETVTATTTVSVTGTSEASVANLTAEVVTESRLQLAWTGSGTSFDVYAVDGGGNELPLITGLVAATATVPIPASERTTVRVYARGDADVSADISLTSLPIVVLPGDYDPYNSLGFTPETPVEGTLRYYLETATAGTVIGFASDVTAIDVYGVDLAPGPLPDTQLDAHLVIDRDLTISGPAGTRVLVTVRSGFEGADPDVAFTYRSRGLLVTAGTTVALENLAITGGTYISNGAGIRNLGDLTLTNVAVTGNRAWDLGGGIFNDNGATLLLVDSSVADNRAETLNDEVNVLSAIRSVDPTEYPEAEFELPDGGFGGGIYNQEGGVVTILSSSIADNYAKISGGGLFNELGATMSVTGTEVVRNLADFSATPGPDASPWYFSWGGGVLNDGALTISGVDLTDNDALEEGGGLRVSVASDVDLSSVAVERNVADYGGGIRHVYCGDATSNLTLTGIAYDANVANVAGADIYSTEDGNCPVAGAGSSTEALRPAAGPLQRDR